MNFYLNLLSQHLRQETSFHYLVWLPFQGLAVAELSLILISVTW